MILVKTMVRNLLISDLTGNIIRFVSPSITVNKLKFSITSKQIKGKIISLLFFNKYEKEEIQMIHKHMRKDLPVLDLGSSLGVVATNAASITNQSILCVEANPSLKQIIINNFANNNVDEERYTVINAAICDPEHTGKPIYFSSRGSNELGRICDADTKGAIRVETALLSNLVQQNVQDDYILISDIEGAEAAFLFADSDALNQCQQLFIELHPVSWKGVDFEVKDLRARIDFLGFEEIEQRGMNFYYTRNENR